MKKLKVDLEEIAMFMENNGRLTQEYYLDTETGEPMVISGAVLERLEDGESINNPTDWEKEQVKVAQEILSESGRYHRVPERPLYEAYNLMREFIEIQGDGALKGNLSRQVHGKNAFRRFKDTIAQYPEVQEQWYTFKQEKLNKEIGDWLNSIGIEPISRRK